MQYDLPHALQVKLSGLRQRAGARYHSWQRSRYEGPLPLSRVENLHRLEQHLRHKESILSSGPFRAELSVTSHCTLDCVMCCGPARDKSLERPWSFFVDLLGDYLDNTIEEVSMIGIGEPTMWPHYRRALRDLTKRGIATRITTNCSHVDHVLESFATDNYSIVHISIDATGDLSQEIRRGYKQKFSWERISGNVAKAMAALRKNPHQPQVILNMAVATYNIQELPNVVRFAEEMGFDLLYLIRVKFGRIFSEGKDVDLESGSVEYQPIVESVRKTARIPIEGNFFLHAGDPDWHCRSIGYSFAKLVDRTNIQCVLPFSSIQHWNGDSLSPCCVLPGAEITSAKEFWNSRYMVDMRKRAYGGSLMPGPCGNGPCSFERIFRGDGFPNYNRNDI